MFSEIQFPEIRCCGFYDRNCLLNLRVVLHNEEVNGFIQINAGSQGSYLTISNDEKNIDCFWYVLGNFVCSFFEINSYEN